MSLERTPEPPSSLKEKKGCRGYWTLDTGWGRDYECGYGTSINCEDCIYGACGGKLDPEVEVTREDTEKEDTERPGTPVWVDRLEDDRIEPYGQWLPKYRHRLRDLEERRKRR